MRVRRRMKAREMEEQGGVEWKMSPSLNRGFSKQAIHDARNVIVMRRRWSDGFRLMEWQFSFYRLQIGTPLR